MLLTSRVAIFSFKPVFPVKRLYVTSASSSSTNVSPRSRDSTMMEDVM